MTQLTAAVEKFVAAFRIVHGLDERPVVEGSALEIADQEVIPK